ncbi:hypothetical protein chiPu_0021342 [Chiloscyllium punctatum]|uniref:Uncharacterized protein n=1 Tax=Chiloscyllium punctatum TaxID=137246 RepID=A0A401RQ30_CHIPU|nr:hypothetical protein [Chiloscyllium punctatum]
MNWTLVPRPWAKNLCEISPEMTKHFVHHWHVANAARPLIGRTGLSISRDCYSVFAPVGRRAARPGQELVPGHCHTHGTEKGVPAMTVPAVMEDPIRVGEDKYIPK